MSDYERESQHPTLVLDIPIKEIAHTYAVTASGARMARPISGDDIALERHYQTCFDEQCTLVVARRDFVYCG